MKETTKPFDGKIVIGRRYLRADGLVLKATETGPFGSFRFLSENGHTYYYKPTKPWMITEEIVDPPSTCPIDGPGLYRRRDGVVVNVSLNSRRGVYEGYPLNNKILQRDYNKDGSHYYGITTYDLVARITNTPPEEFDAPPAQYTPLPITKSGVYRCANGMLVSLLVPDNGVPTLIGPMLKNLPSLYWYSSGRYKILEPSPWDIVEFVEPFVGTETCRVSTYHTIGKSVLGAPEKPTTPPPLSGLAAFEAYKASRIAFNPTAKVELIVKPTTDLTNPANLEKYPYIAQIKWLTYNDILRASAVGRAKTPEAAINNALAKLNVGPYDLEE